MNIQQTKILSAYAIFMGVLFVSFSFISYQFFQPSVITDEISVQLQKISLVFYILVFSGIALIAYGISTMLRVSSGEFSFSSPSATEALQGLYPLPLSKIIVSIINDNKYFRFFWPASVSYGIFYGVISGMLIYRIEDFSSLYGTVAVPSINIITYGPLGYVPTMAIYLTQHIGILIIPLNLLVAVVVSSLVGFNFVLSIYAFMSRPRRYAKSANTKTVSLLSVVGATTSLFAACPTCASYYILSMAGGSLTPVIAAFAVTFYSLIFFLSIPLLALTPILTALNIRKMLMLNGRCSL